MEELKKEPMTAVLIALNLLVFLAVEITGSSQDVDHMIAWGAAYTPLIVKEGQFYRVFTSMFLHFGMEHLANNMLVLFVLGGRLERTTGKVKFLMIYLLGGIAGNVLSVFIELGAHEWPVSAGASGAVFALIGAMIYVLIRSKGRMEDLTARQILVMAGFSLYFGFTSSGVDNAAHVGGLLGGFVWAFLLYHPRRIQNADP